MKRLYNILFVCVCALALVSCLDDAKVKEGTDNTPSAEKGVLMLNVGTRSSEGNDPSYTINIHQIVDSKSTLVRKYTKEDKPEYIWLLEGDYYTQVVCGEPIPATFNGEEKYYIGSSLFNITGGESTNVDIVAVCQNVPVKVNFDQTITEGFLDGYHVEVWANDDVKLRYTESAEGYFIMPQNITTLSWRFVGTFVYDDNGERVEVNKSGSIENVELKKAYSLSFKFSKDASGLLNGLNATLDESIEERDDHLAFSPDPELKGVGFDLAAPYNYTGGERLYVATSPSLFNNVLITMGNREFDPVSNVIPGITLTGLNSAQLYITLSDDFFNSLSEGSQIINMRVFDADGGSVARDLPYNLQGVKALNHTSINLWSGTAPITATVFGAPASVDIICREGEGEWNHYTASSDGTNTYKAHIEGLKVDTTYEYNLVINGKTVGTSIAFRTEKGVQIPTGGLEDWCKDGDGVIIPYHTSSNPYWCTGNYGTAILSKNITQSSSDVRPGSTGTKSMYMDSEYIVVKFAAGNGYIGSWGGMDGTNAKVFFGQPFAYNAKPKAIRFWAKWNCGKIDKVSGKVGQKGNPDLCKIFCCMTTDTHLVDSSDAGNTTFNPSDDDIKSGDTRYNKVLYSAYMSTTESQTEWKQIEIPFSFYGTDPNQVPTHLILTFTCSGYGDFFDGSTDSWLYIDDIEFVY